MTDIVHPLKEESSEDFGYYAELDSSEDGVSAKAFIFEDSLNQKIEIIDSEMTFEDTITGQRKLSEFLIPSTHRLLNQLVHTIAEDSYLEITRSNNKVTNATFWDSISKTYKIREFDITYSLNFVSSVTTKQYDQTGTLVETLTQTISRDSNNRVTSISSSLT